MSTVRMCRVCGSQPAEAYLPRCLPCQRIDGEISVERSKWTKWAMGKVARAIRRGELSRIGDDTACADCGKRATEYDHRDYAKPIDVVAVCHSCNLKRGSAMWPRGELPNTKQG